MPGVFVCLRFGVWVWVWGHIRCFGCRRWRFRSYSESLFQTPKRNQKALPLAYGPLAGARGSRATVSIRGHRLRFASLHLLSMNAASPHGAARLPPDEHLRSACRWGKRSRAEARSQAKSKARSRALTLALSRRERGLTGVFGRGTPTRDTESNSSFEKPTNRLPLPRERAGRAAFR